VEFSSTIDLDFLNSTVNNEH